MDPMTQEQREQLVSNIRNATREEELEAASIRAEFRSMLPTVDPQLRSLMNEWLNQQESQKAAKEALYMAFIEGSVSLEELHRWLEMEAQDLREQKERRKREPPADIINELFRRICEGKPTAN